MAKKTKVHGVKVQPVYKIIRMGGKMRCTNGQSFTHGDFL